MSELDDLALKLRNLEEEVRNCLDLLPDTVINKLEELRISVPEVDLSGLPLVGRDLVLRLTLWLNLINKYFYLLKELRKALLYEDIPFIENPASREIVKSIAFKHPLPLQKQLQELANAEDPELLKLLFGDFEHKEELLNRIYGGLEDQEPLDLFYYYGGGDAVDYFERLYEAGVLILDFPNIPPHLRDYVREAKHCYASGQELAMCILCRAILETSLNDLAYREWGRLGVEIKPDRSEVAQTSIRELINGLLKRDPVLKRRAHKVVDVCNRCVHPAAWAEPVVPVDPREFLQETLSVVQEIYKHTDFPR